jgi:phosphoribosylformylglycinamidine synthase I
MKFAVISFPGSNCDADCVYAVGVVMGQEAELVWHTEKDLSAYDAIVLPGGFSYGDYLRVGAIARFSPVMEAIRKEADKGKPVLGICNGFQILVEAGLLPGALLRNRTLQFICDMVHLRVENDETAFSRFEKKVVRMPIAHAAGNYYIEPEGLRELEENRQIVFRYGGPDGEVSDATNPNGSVSNIAGIVNRQGNVLGMMPHPERCSELELGSDDGSLLFDSLIRSMNGGPRKEETGEP